VSKKAQKTEISDGEIARQLRQAECRRVAGRLIAAGSPLDGRFVRRTSLPKKPGMTS
jgi:hypothetical protein